MARREVFGGVVGCGGERVAGGFCSAEEGRSGAVEFQAEGVGMPDGVRWGVVLDVAGEAFGPLSRLAAEAHGFGERHPGWEGAAWGLLLVEDRHDAVVNEDVFLVEAPADEAEVFGDSRPSDEDAERDWLMVFDVVSS